MTMPARSSVFATALSAFVAATALLTAGCADITGTWERRDWEEDDTRNVMTLGSDETGAASIFYVRTEAADNWHEDEFEIEWTELSDDEFELQMVCVASTRTSGSCDGDNFTMTCDLSGDASKLDCTGTGEWTNYEFEWDKD